MAPDPKSTLQLIEKTGQEISRIVEEIARLCDKDLAPAEFYGEFLKRVLTVLSAPAGAVWILTAQGHLQLQYQINIGQVGLDRSAEGRQSHDELLRQAIQQAQPIHLPPHSSPGSANDGGAVAGNPTDYVILLAPIVLDKQQVGGLVEVWQGADRHPKAMQGFLQFVTRMANLASRYIRNHQLRHMVGQQQIWTQLEAFARQIHGSLNPTEVAYLVANEGRRLVDCDRISVAVRYGRRPSVVAISGADVVEKRSNLVQLMRALADHVLTWGEKLIYSGKHDESLPPDVLKALDAFLAESNSKLLVVVPLRDEREKESKRPARSAVLMESFEPSAAPEQLVAQLEVIGRHATPALYNAVEHRRIPMRWIWQPLAKVQDGLGGKARAILTSIALALVLFIGAMLFVPYPLKMEAKGQLLPEERRWVYSPTEGIIEMFTVKPGSLVVQDQSLILMYDSKLHEHIIDLQGQIAVLDGEIRSANELINLAGAPLAERTRAANEAGTKTIARDSKRRELDAFLEKNNAQKDKPGFFWIKSPLDGTVLNSHFEEELTRRQVKPSDQLLRIGNKEKRWEIELKIPQKHIGQILAAFPKEPNAEREVDLLLTSDPTHVYKGKLARDKIAGEATPNRDENNESEPVVVAWVRIEGPDIAPEDTIPRDRLVAGVEVHSKIRCGNRAMGYSLFYGVWEWFYEKVVFWF